jgi:hypothetical protein
MTKDEALRLALEALENGKRVRNAEGGTKYQPDLEDKAITAIKAALEAKDEPVAWYHAEDFKTHFTTEPSDDMVKNGYWQPLYTTPPPCPTCEALARTVMLDQTSHDTTPPQRTWVEIADEDYIKALELCDFDKDAAFEFFEAKLKDKNT